jgi:hypothetical protein
MNRQGIRGVTRLELLLATASVSVAALVGAWLTGGTDAGREDQAVATARRIVEAASEWRREHDVGCPTLTQLIVDRTWQRDARADDPWGGRFLIHCSTEEVNVRSAGRDGRFRTKDDVSVSAPWTS